MADGSSGCCTDAPVGQGGRQARQAIVRGGRRVRGHVMFNSPDSSGSQVCSEGPTVPPTGPPSEPQSRVPSSPPT